MQTTTLSSSPEFHAKIDLDYLQNLHKNQEKLEQTLNQRMQEKKKATVMYQEFVKKQMEMLLRERQKMSERNEKFLNQSRKYTQQVGEMLPEVIDKEQQLKELKLSYVAALQRFIDRRPGGSAYKQQGPIR